MNTQAATQEDGPLKKAAGVEVRPASVAGFGRARPFWIVAGAGLASLLSVVLAAVFLPVALATFSAVFATVSELAGVPAGRSVWVLWGAFFFGTLAACGLAYLLLDRASLLGYGRARALLARKAAVLLPQVGANDDAAAAATPRFFVLLGQNLPGVRRPWEDIGWLLVDDERLHFVGDRLFISVPRPAAARLSRGPNLAAAGLGGATLTLEVEGGGQLRFQSRDADLVSATGEGAARLETALRTWLAGDFTPGHDAEPVLESMARPRR